MHCLLDFTHNYPRFWLTRPLKTARTRKIYISCWGYRGVEYEKCISATGDCRFTLISSWADTSDLRSTFQLEASRQWTALNDYINSEHLLSSRLLFRVNLIVQSPTKHQRTHKFLPVLRASRAVTSFIALNAIHIYLRYLVSIVLTILPWCY